MTDFSHIIKRSALTARNHLEEQDWLCNNLGPLGQRWCAGAYFIDMETDSSVAMIATTYSFACKEDAAFFALTWG